VGGENPRRNPELKTIGRHLIAEYYGCDPRILDDVQTIRSIMLRAADAVGATVMGETFHAFAPQGVSGSVVIAESHLSIHTWPENGYVALDIYTCGGLNPRRGFELLGSELKAESYRLQEIIRGLPEDVDAHGPLEANDVKILARTSPVQHLTTAVVQGPLS
jgi:S-adenosylmethionine decarboxylase